MRLITIILTLLLFSMYYLNAQSGNVGIGTANPDTTLHIVGKLKLVDGQQAVGKVLTSDNEGIATWTNYVELDPTLDVDSLNIIPRWDGNQLVNGTIIDNGTNVGIGVLNPTFKLEVDGDINVNSMRIGRGNGNLGTNLVVGAFSLRNTTGGNNTALGHSTLDDNTSGSYNTAIGYSALRTNISGESNTAVGWASLQTSKGSENTAIGVNAIATMQTGSQNTASGFEALYLNTLGSNNTAIGYRSGRNNLGAGNVFLGNRAGELEEGSNTLYIDNSDTANPLIYGDFANDTVKVHGTLNIANEYSFPTTDGTAGQILTTDGNGATTWQNELDPTLDVDSLNITPRWDGNQLVNGTIIDNGTNVGIGVLNPNFKLEVDGDINVNSMRIGRGNGNLGTNLVVGAFSLRNTTGGNNTALGHSTLDDNTSGSYNTAIGYSALRTNISGESNTAVGWASLQTSKGSENTAIGVNAIATMQTGSQNTASGFEALYLNTLGSNNTAVGYRSGRNNLGAGNVFLGNRAGELEEGSNTLYIDNSDTATPLIYGDFANDALTVNGTMHITQTAKLEPLAAEPTCATADAGLIYFDNPSKKLRVCDGTAWQDLH